MSLNQWIAAAVAEKVGVVEAASDFFEKRAKGNTGKGLERFLLRPPKRKPKLEDRKQ